MDFQTIYLINALLVTAIMIWGKLEWHASLLLGLTAPFVGMILAFPIRMFFGRVLPASMNFLQEWLGYTAYVLVVVGIFFLAKRLRQAKIGNRGKQQANEDPQES